ncbi:cysteine-rich receptor-like protein kinase [Trifolium pratense]|uniref:Cysteine-rich receptor-like protein kinase n=1 Tax=Trifolium pratense TaxID=57577 RepID=A0A2K3PA54_TRIPR|nr:cysteine-rich receptor-like protein kinase [Trifolium pratense]
METIQPIAHIKPTLTSFYPISLTTQKSARVFYNFSYGQNTDKVNAIGLCRGDVKPDDCRNCLNDSRVLLTRLCPNQKEAIGWYDNCMLRYSNRSIFGIMEGEPLFRRSNPNSVTECTPDLSMQDCNHCLDDAISEIPSCCNNKIGVVVLLSFVCICLRRNRHSKPTNLKEIEEEEEEEKYDDDDDDDDIEIVESLQFNFDTISVATSNFSEANKLGHGGFGVVYRGKLSDGQAIAVKRLSRDSGQGDIEFKNEVLLLVKLQHRNLVRLLGFCLEGRERLLVYEFVPNKSLDYFIFGRL